MMKKITILTMLGSLYLAIGSWNPSEAACGEGSWLAAWTDAFGQTTYTMEGPCTAVVGESVLLKAAATDVFFPNSYVGAKWSIRDNGSLILGSSGLNWIKLTNGRWQQSVTQTYSVAADHAIKFMFTDLGRGEGATGWAAASIGNTVSIREKPAPVNNPPVADAGPNLFIASYEQSGVILQGSATDAEGNPLIYRWLEGASVVQAPRAVDSTGAAPLDLATLSSLSLGEHSFTLEVTDGTSTVTDTAKVTVENSAPVVSPVGNATLQIGDDLFLRGSVADYDGDMLTYRWIEGTTVLVEGIISSVAGGEPVTLPDSIVIHGLPLGDHTLLLEVTDGVNAVAGRRVVTVIDTVAPSLSPSATPTILWPPNHKMRDVVISANAGDNGGGAVLLSVVISDNQRARDKKGRESSNFSVVSIDQEAGTLHLQLRAERSGKKADHIYTITISATDASGNESRADVLVTVPHDAGARSSSL